MPEGDGWLWRPVAEGLCKYESVITPGALSLYDIAVMNDIITVKHENEHRLMEANRDER